MKLTLSILQSLVMLGSILAPNIGTTATLDQQVELSTPLQSAGIYPTQWAAQTFTSGITGQLDSLDLVLYGGDAKSQLTIEFRTFQILLSGTLGCAYRCLAPDFSSSGLIGQIQVPGSALPPISATDVWTNMLTASANIQFVEGHQYAIVLSINTASNINWRNNNDPNGTLGDRYPRGEAFASSGPDPAQAIWYSLGAADFNFRTYASVVPESSRTSLFIVGFALVFAFHLKRTRRERTVASNTTSR